MWALKAANDELETRVAVFDQKNEELKSLSEVLEKQNCNLTQTFWYWWNNIFFLENILREKKSIQETIF